MLALETTVGCANTPRVLFALEESGTRYDVVVRDDGWFTRRYGVSGPLFRDGEIEVLETNAILRHVARRYGPSTLLPIGVDELAQVDRWMDFFGARIVWILMRLSLLRSLSSTQVDPTVLAGETTALFDTLRVADRWLASREYLVDRFTVADCAAAMLMRLRQRFDLSELPNLITYADRIGHRPAWRRALDRWPNVQSHPV